MLRYTRPSPLWGPLAHGILRQLDPEDALKAGLVSILVRRSLVWHGCSLLPAELGHRPLLGLVVDEQVDLLVVEGDQAGDLHEKASRVSPTPPCVRWCLAGRGSVDARSAPSLLGGRAIFKNESLP